MLEILGPARRALQRDGHRLVESSRIIATAATLGSGALANLSDPTAIPADLDQIRLAHPLTCLRLTDGGARRAVPRG